MQASPRIRRKLMPVLHILLLHHKTHLRIPDHQVGIAAGGDAAFLLQSEEIRRVFA